MAYVPSRRINWKDKQAVCDYARDLALASKLPMLVVKYDGRNNYNIMHKSRRDLWDRHDVTVVYEAHVKED